MHIDIWYTLRSLIAGEGIHVCVCVFADLHFRDSTVDSE